MTQEEFDKLTERVSKLERLSLGSSITNQGCLWDGMPETSPGSGMKIGMLSCPCPKCSHRY